MFKKLTVKEASEELRISPDAIRRGLRQKELPIGWAVKNDTEYSYFIYQEMIDSSMCGSEGEGSTELLGVVIECLTLVLETLKAKKDLKNNGK